MFPAGVSLGTYTSGFPPSPELPASGAVDSSRASESPFSDAPAARPAWEEKVFVGRPFVEERLSVVEEPPVPSVRPEPFDAVAEFEARTARIAEMVARFESLVERLAKFNQENLDSLDRASASIVDELTRNTEEMLERILEAVEDLALASEDGLTRPALNMVF